VIKEIAFVAYPAQDVAALRSWYEKNLGLTFSNPYLEDVLKSTTRPISAAGTLA
jgi:hypothetical protein